MTNLFLNQKQSSDLWRKEIFNGSIYLLSKENQPQQLGNFAESCIKKYFGEDDYLTSYLNWPKEVFIKKASNLKKHFTNCQEVKEIIRAYIIELDENPQEYYFDVPRLRVIPNYDFMHVGVSYAYQPHRDTWYGIPPCQINFWMPVFTIEPFETMPIFPIYFNKFINNSSQEFDLKHWVEVERAAAVSQVSTETRNHPLANEEINEEGKLLLAGNRGDMIIFSAHHLHGSQKNTGERIRFSVDFRLYHHKDLLSDIGAKNLDDKSTSKDYALRDLFRASDFSKFN